MRLMRFRGQLVTLWHAFWHPSTPLYLKALMVGVLAYVISPVDMFPDLFAVVGWIDDALLVAFAVNWIMSRLPDDVFRSATSRGPRRTNPNAPQSHQPFTRTHAGDHSGPTINGRSRRL